MDITLDPKSAPIIQALTDALNRLSAAIEVANAKAPASGAANAS